MSNNLSPHDHLPTLVLISDTEIHSIFLRHKLFQKYHVHTMATQEIDLKYFLKMDMDVIVIDDTHLASTLPSLCAKLKQSQDLHFIPILVISSNLKRPYWEELKKSGVLDILSEPLEEDELLIKLAHAKQYKEAHQKVDMVAKQRGSASPSPPLTKKTVFNQTDVIRLQKNLLSKKALTLLVIETDQPLDKVKIRGADLLIPLGNKEQLLILDGLTRKEGVAFASHLIKLYPDIHLGLVSQDPTEQILFPSLEEMIRVAKQCLLEAKSTGRTLIAYIQTTSKFGF